MKRIGNCIYCHKSNIDNLDKESLNMINEALKIINKTLKGFEVIKICKKENYVTLVKSSDWNSSREPMVEDAYKISLNDGTIKLSKKKKNVQIYHHKWQFVDKNYKGFNYEEAKKWSEKWEATLPKTKEIKSRIGYKSYWIEILKQYNLE